MDGGYWLLTAPFLWGIVSRMRSIAMVWLTTLALPARAEPPTWSLELLEGVLRPFHHRSVGDLDGDGLDDGVYVAYARVHVRLGRGRPEPDPTEAPDWAHDYPMPIDGDVLTMAPAGDVDGDSLADFAVGVVNQAPAGAGIDFLDYVVVRHGAKRPAIVSPTPWVIADTTPGTRFGSALAAGDVNGDGFTDLAIGAPGDPLDPLALGRVALHLGSPIGLEAREAASLNGVAGFGGALAILDYDGDGQADLLVGGPDGVELHRGQRRVNDEEIDLTPLELAPRLLSVTPVFDPQALFGAGDLDGDGFADAVRVDVPGNRIDILLGHASPDPGRTVTVSPSAWGLTLSSDIQPTAFDAINVVPAGDLDGDGFADLAFTALTAEPIAGGPTGAFVLFGGPDPSGPPVRIERELAHGLYTLGDLDGDGHGDLMLDQTIAFGRATAVGPGITVASSDLTPAGAPALEIAEVACVGDVDADGFDDVVVTSRGEEGGGCVGCARTLLLHGGRDGLTPAYDAPGEPGDSQRTVARVGDVDGDGYADVLLAAELAPADGEPDAGRAWLLWGGATALGGRPAWEVHGAGRDHHLGHDAAGAGDVDGDGRMDLLFDVRGTINGPDAALWSYREGEVRSVFRWRTPLKPGEGVFRGSPVGLGDVSGDGLADLGFLRFDPSAEPSLTFSLSHGTPNGPDAERALDLELDALDFPKVAGDLDGDGLADLVGLSGGHGGDPVVAATIVRGAPELVRAGAERYVVVDDARLTDEPIAALPMAIAAGDLDGDGFDDLAVLVPARAHLEEGRLAVFRGAPSALSLDFVREAAFADGDLGISATGACDIDGDRFADLIVRATPEHGRQRLDIHHGNGAFGHRSAFGYAAFAVQPDTGAPIAPGGRSHSPTAFTVRALGRSPYGRGGMRLELEVKRINEPFEGRPTVVGDFAVAPAGFSVPVFATVEGLQPDTAYRWRARIGYARTQAPLTGHSRWFGGTVGPVPNRVDVRTRGNAAPIPEDDVVVADNGFALMTAPGILANDADPDDDALTAAAVTRPQQGELLYLSANGGFSYRAEPGARGVDTFTYAVTDGLGPPVHATVTIVLDACERCATGDWFVAVRTTTGALRSVHCWVDASGEPTCETDGEGNLVLGDPVCAAE